MSHRKSKLSIAIQLTLAVGLSQSASAQVFPAVFELAELDGSNGFGINGLADDDRAGSISHVIDLNHDGIDDIVIGASGVDANGIDSGRVYVVFGTPSVADGSFDLSTLNGSNGFVINGESSDDQAGSVAAAGDVNGDGIADLIIGAQGAGASGNGRAYIVFGSSSGFPESLNLSSMNGVNGIFINGEAINETLGRAVAGGGDFNGDGIDDIIIGDPYSDANGFNSGRSYVVFGNDTGLPNPLELSSLNGTNGFVSNGEASGDQFGRAVSAAGDVNADGIDDLLISAPRVDVNDIDSGRSYLIYGTTSGLPNPFNSAGLNGLNGFFINGEAFADNAGGSISDAGDINADGIDDLIIGAAGADNNGDQSGRSYVLFGSDQQIPSPFQLSLLNGTNGFTLNGENATDLSGISVGKAGDINGDGIDDFAIGAAGADINDPNSGRAYVVFGSDSTFPNPLELSNLDGNNGFALNGEVEGKYAGSRVRAGGDINGDGIDDLLISSFSAGTKYGESTGRVWVVFGRPSIDLAVIKTNGQPFVDPEGSVRYIIDASNAGPVDVFGAMLTDHLPSTLHAATAIWTCDEAIGTVCPSPSGTGNLNQIIDLPAGSSLSFSITADVVASEGEVITNTVSIALPGELVDADPSNNSATDSDPTGLFADSFEIDL